VEFFAVHSIRGVAPATAARLAWDAMADGITDAREDLRERDYAELVRVALKCHGALLSRELAGRFLDAIYVSGPEGGKVALPGACETLLALRNRGFLLAMVTNRSFGGERFRADMARAGLDIGWDAESVSVEVGFRKPHHRLFGHALEQLGVEPASAMMIGDSLAQDIAGAQQLGMATAWRISTPDAEGVLPDISFHELPELLDISVLRGAA
jgi:FMN phosphatase YigB (HAD superfamily)